MMRTHSRHRRGVTLVELAAVLGIASVMLTLALQSWNRMQRRYQVREDARGAAQLLRMARLQAVSTGTPSGVEVREDRLVMFRKADPRSTAVTREPGDVTVEELPIAHTAQGVPLVAFAGGLSASETLTVVFNRLGLPTVHQGASNTTFDFAAAPAREYVLSLRSWKAEDVEVQSVFLRQDGSSGVKR